MSIIRILDEQVANQIAAGEVVERPASVIKELVENAIDAGATSIQVEIQQGGRNLRVIDNGAGIPADSLSLAFRRFATSKLQDYGDIWQLTTMGFRGEALPSIASIAKVEAISRPASQELGRRIVLHGGQRVEEADTGAPVGTHVLVDELFFNTPARLKFMRQESTEFGYVTQLLTAFALSFPNISFRLLKNGKEALFTSGQASLMGAIRQLFGKELTESLFTVSFETTAGQVTGALSYPNFVRRDRNRQFFFVNKRWVEVAGIKRLLEEIYENLIPKKFYPVAILSLDIPADQIDVNVHPTKKEVKFKQFYRVGQLIRQGIERELSAYHTAESRAMESPAGLSRGIAPASQASYFPPDEELAPFEAAPAVQQPPAFYLEPRQLELPVMAAADLPPEKTPSRDALADIRPIAQMGDRTYIVAHYGNGLALIDQHIADERYRYENLIAKPEITSQQLLISVIVELDAIDRGILEENQALFEQMGFEVEAFGPQSVAIRAVPQYLEHLADIEVTFRELLHDLRESGLAKSRLEQFNMLCKTIACHGAVRAGDPLTMEQIEVLINNWLNTQNPYTCPHGRPILLRFSKHELDRRFMRV